ncbi:unannotated protein [freshwater metagenome]|uniref:Unannotated protein n=1 Tax=freshwater metagenome TaxID=449393 RepID=A0A6J7MX71_9ZZZZ
MSDFAPVLVSLVVILLLVFLLSRRFNISSRYERKPKVHTPWSALDSGIDPTKDGGDK